ncbi:chitin-binding domain-containing protein, partial [Streptomyces sp. PU_AKi4]|uniref:chitin binding peritrophin-A domain-containing protein n=1 Tax=Streptomyces sp. PU_AKi4 TaxID=2800809 RepID=UPI00352576F3
MNRTRRAATALLLALAGLACAPTAQAAATPPACTEEGFFPDPDDQSKFYRCVDMDGDGTELTRFDFQCGPGTLFHPELGSVFKDHQIVDHGGVVRRHELTDQEWELLAPLIPRAATGRPRVSDRQVINGMV